MAITREEKLFSQWYLRLSELSNPKSEFDLVQTSHILRLLLNEGLWNKANKRTNINIEFIVNVPPDNLQDELSKVLGKIIVRNDATFFAPPLGNPKYNRKMSPRDFLQMKTQLVNELPVSVRTLINYCANILGGVHVGTPKGKEKEIHTELEGISSLKFGGAHPSLRQIIPIVRITLDGLKPLFDSLIGNTNPE